MKSVLFNLVKWIYAYSFLVASAILVMMAGGCSNSQSEGDEGDPALETEEATSQPQQINMLTEDEKKDGWKLLFDGVSTNEWTGTKGEGFPEKGWVIEDGILTVLGSNGSDHASGGILLQKTSMVTSNCLWNLKFQRARIVVLSTLW